MNRLKLVRTLLTALLVLGSVIAVILYVETKITPPLEKPVDINYYKPQISTFSGVTSSNSKGKNDKEDIKTVNDTTVTVQYYDFSIKNSYKSKISSYRENQIKFNKSIERDVFINRLKNGGMETLGTDLKPIKAYVRYGSGAQKGNAVERITEELGKIKGLSFEKLDQKTVSEISKLQLKSILGKEGAIFLPNDFHIEIMKNEKVEKYLYLIQFFDTFPLDLGNGYTGIALGNDIEI